MKNKWVKYVIVLVLGLAVGGGLGLYLLSQQTNINDLYAKSHQAYQQGLKSYEAKDGAHAALRFDEARIQADKTIKIIDEKLRTDQTMAQAERDRLVSMQAESLWLYSQAVRDRAYATALKDGEPLALEKDLWLGTEYRSLVRIPDMKARQEALNTLLMARPRLPGSLDPQREVLRVSAQLQKLNWNLLTEASKTILAMKPELIKDPRDLARANYFMARYDLEQPKALNDGSWIATSAQKRKLDRVEDARKYLAAMQKVPNIPFWLARQLEAAVTDWLYIYNTDVTKQPLSAQQEKHVLEQLLYQPETGAFPKLKKTDPKSIDLYSARAIYELFRIGLTLAAKNFSADLANQEKLWTLFNENLNFCKKMIEAHSAHRFIATEAASSGLMALRIVQPKVIQAPDAPINWKESIERVDALVRDAHAQKVTDLDIFAAYSNFLAQEARLRANRGENAWADELQKKSVAWLEKGLKQGIESKRPENELLTLRALAAERAAIQGKATADFEKNLAALKATKSPQAQALANLLEGVLAIRQGRLKDSIQSLVLCLGNVDAPQYHQTANFMLGHVYMALKQPDAARPYLEKARRAFRELQALTPEEEAWAREFLRNEDEIITALVEANLQTARKRASDWKKLHPGEPIPLSVLSAYEKTARNLINDLPPKPAKYRIASQRALATHFQLTAREEEARKVLEQLKMQYPGEAIVVWDLIRLNIAEAQREAIKKKKKLTDEEEKTLIERGDVALKQFRRDYPGSEQGKLLWASWLIQTKRVPQAVEFLKDRTEFPDEKDARYRWTLAQALLKQGNREASAEILQNLPQSQQTIAALILLAPTKEEKKKWIQTGLASFEQKGLFLYSDGVLALSEDRPLDAASKFIAALEHSKVTEAARVGIQRALFALAKKNPAGAVEEINKLIKKRPDEWPLYVGYAYTSMLLNNIGEPNDQWSKKRNMCSALNKCHDLLFAQTGKKATGWMLKAGYWISLNDPKQAFQAVRQALIAEPNNPQALQLAARLAFNSPSEDVKKEAQVFLDRLKKAQPDDTTTRAMEAGLLEDAGKVDEAIAAWKKLQEDHPGITMPYLQLIRLLSSKKKTDEVEKLIQTWRKNMPHNLTVLAAEIRHLATNGKTEQAHKVSEEFLQKEMARAKDKWTKDTSKSPAETKERLEKLEAGICTGIAATFNQMQLWNDAEKWLAKVPEMKEPYLPALQHWGQLYLGRQEWQKAADIYEKILAKEERDIVARNNLAWLLADRLNKPEEALKVARKGGEGLNPGQPLEGDRLPAVFLDTLGIIYVKLDRRDLDQEMEKVFQAAVRRYPEDPRMYLFLGHAYLGQRDLFQARRMFADAKKMAAVKGAASLSDAERQQVIQKAEKGLTLASSPK